MKTPNYPIPIPTRSVFSNLNINSRPFTPKPPNERLPYNKPPCLISYEKSKALSLSDSSKHELKCPKKNRDNFSVNPNSPYSIISWNCRSLNSRSKATLATLWNSDIKFIQEIWKPSSTDLSQL